VLNTIAAARAQGFAGRFVYMTSIGVTRKSFFAWCLNVWKGNTLLWRRRAEDAIRSSGFDYCIVRAAFLLNRPPDRHAICITHEQSPLTLRHFIARADVVRVLVAAAEHPNASHATLEVKWCQVSRQASSDSLDFPARPSRIEHS
jgi:uncharacterized protein YbjT (DUF2867 family)